MDDAEYVTPSGTRRKRMTTAGWDLLVEWKGGGTDWIPLKDMKEAYPVETAEYAVANKIAEQPAFGYWVRQALKTRDRMIKKVKSQYWKRTHKYGIELPKSVNEAIAVDANTGTTFWKDAIEMELQNVMPTFEHVAICYIASEKLKPTGSSRHDGVLTKPPEYTKTNLANKPTKSLPGARR
jgi:hypothetical protein